VDMRHEFSRRYWLYVLMRLLHQGRRPMTKIAWLDRYRSTSTAA